MAVPTGWTDCSQFSFSVSGAFPRRGRREEEMATRLLPVHAQVSEGFFLQLSSWFGDREHAEAIVELYKAGGLVR